MTKIIRPTEPEILKWVIHTSAHAYNIEYNLQRLQVGSQDPDRPHDIVSPGNKFEWEAVRGFALQFRRDGNDYSEQILASREFHRQQYHHQMFGQYYPNAPEDAMRLGAVDAICSLLEPREYQGGCHTFAEISEVIGKNPIHKIGWLRLAAAEMKQIEQPDILAITDLSKIPREGIRPETYDTITERAHEALRELEKDHGYQFRL